MGSCSSKPMVSRNFAKGKQPDRTKRGLSGAVSPTNLAEGIEMRPIDRDQGEQSNFNQSDTLSPSRQANPTDQAIFRSLYRSMAGAIAGSGEQGPSSARSDLQEPLPISTGFPFHKGPRCQVRLQACPSGAVIDKQCQNIVWHGRWCSYHYKMLQTYVTKYVLDARLVVMCADWYDQGVLAVSLQQTSSSTHAALLASVQNPNASGSRIRNAGPSETRNGGPSGTRNGESSGTRSGAVYRGDNGESSGIRNGEFSGTSNGESSGAQNSVSLGDESGKYSRDQSGESSRDLDVGGSLDISRLKVYTNPRIGSEGLESGRESQEGQMPPFVPVIFDEGEAS